MLRITAVCHRIPALTSDDPLAALKAEDVLVHLQIQIQRASTTGTPTSTLRLTKAETFVIHL